MLLKVRHVRRLALVQPGSARLTGRVSEEAAR